MWYLAEILFAQTKQPDRRMYLCESCNVLLQADSANEAYQKAETWGKNYATQGRFELLGVSDLTTIGDEIGDGIDICGRYFRKLDVWQRKDQLIVPPDELKAIQWEGNGDIPLEEMLDPNQANLLKQRFENC